MLSNASTRTHGLCHWGHCSTNMNFFLLNRLLKKPSSIFERIKLNRCKLAVTGA